MTNEEAFELKAQALNNDPNLKAARIAALKFVGDKNYIVNGDFSPEPPPQENMEAPSTVEMSIPVRRRTLHVFVRIPREDGYELKAKALNRDPRLKRAGITGFRLVGDKQYVVDGDFNPTIPATGEGTIPMVSETKTSFVLPKRNLHVFVRMKSEDAYKLLADHLNEVTLLPEAGISDVRLVRKQTRVPPAAPPLETRAQVGLVEHVSRQPPPVSAGARKKKRSYWGCLLGGILLGVLGVGIVVAGFFLYNTFLPNRQVPAQAATVESTPSSTPRPQPTPTRTLRPTQTRDVAATEAHDEIMAEVQRYFEEGYLASTHGEFYPMDDYTMELADIDTFDYGSGYDFVQNFAVWADIYWENASPVNTPQKSGCGFAYRIQENGNGYIAILSNDEIVMDVCDDVSCRPLGTTRGTGRVQFGDPAQARLSLVVNENHAFILVNGQFISEYSLPRDELSNPGTILYALLSGTNHDFGTRCEFSNARLWVSEP